LETIYTGFGKPLIISNECIYLVKGYDKTNSKKTNNKRIAVFSIIVGIGITMALYYLVSPLFISTEINEQLPSNTFSPSYQEFEEMTEGQRIHAANNMSSHDKNQMLIQYANVGNSSRMDETMDNNNNNTIIQASSRIGPFVGVGDGIHNAEGIAKIISLDDNSNILRLEDLKATSGPDLYVYLATDKSASDSVSLGRLKANNGNQNYEIPLGTDLSKHDTVLIWCKAFSVLFGSAELKI
jgi:hypothetical protein